MNCPQPYAKNCRAGIQTKVCQTPEPFLSPYQAVLQMSLSMETARQPCKKHGPLSYGQAVELREPSEKNVGLPPSCLLKLVPFFFLFCQHLSFLFSSITHLPFPPKQNQVVQSVFVGLLLRSALCYTLCTVDRVSCPLGAHGPALREDGHRGKVREQTA